MLVIFKLLRNIILGLFGIFYTTFMVGCIPIFLILFGSLHIVRQIVANFAKCLRPDLGKLVTVRGFLITQGQRNNPLYNSHCLAIAVEGKIDSKRIRNIWNTKVINSKLDNGQLRYPELQQYTEKWLGYLFWKQDKSFSLDKHIRKYEDKMQDMDEKSFTVMDSKKLVQIRNEVSMAVYKRNQSPWEIILIQNYLPKNAVEGKEYSVILFRWHHSLADAYSICKLFVVQLQGIKLKLEAKPTYAKTNQFFMFLKMLGLLVCKMFELAYKPLRFYDRNAWHLPVSKVSNTFYVSIPDPIPLAEIKEIATAHGVTVSSVVQSIIAGGLRRMMVKRELKIPKEMVIACPLPLPQHPEKLRNHATCAAFPFPVGIQEPSKRLVALNRCYLDIKQSPLAFFNNIGASIVGAVPYWLLRPLSTISYATLFISNFPGPSDCRDYFGYPLVSIDCTVTPPRGSWGVSTIAFSSNGNVYMSISIERNLLGSESEVNEIAEFLLEEMKALKSATV